MPLKGIRTELEILQSHLGLPEPDLDFILLHAESLINHARSAATGSVYPDTAKEDQEMIERYMVKKSQPTSL